VKGEARCRNCSRLVDVALQKLQRRLARHHESFIKLTLAERHKWCSVSRSVANDRAPSSARIVAGLFGEFLREAAVLIAVFAPLDKVLQNLPLTARFMGVTLVIVAVLFGIGAALEVKRQ